MANTSVLADRIQSELMSLHRGSYFCDVGEHMTNMLVVYGNDCYSTDRRSQRQVELLREQLEEHCILETWFSVSADGKTWVMGVHDDNDGMIDDEWLHNLVWECWFRAYGVKD